MKKRVVTLLLMLVGFASFACADYDVEVLKANLKQRGNRMMSFSGDENDYIYIKNTEDETGDADKKKSKNSETDALMCIGKNGKISHEMTVVHPEDAEFLAAFEGDDKLMLIYHQKNGKGDMIWVNKVDRKNVAPKWNPELLLYVKAKKKDYLQYDISPDKSHFVVGMASRKSKKDNYTLNIATLDRKGNKCYEQSPTLYYMYERVYFFDVTVNNDGVTYCSFFNKSKKSSLSKVYVYVLNGTDCKEHSEDIGISWYYNYPFHATAMQSGGFVLAGVSSNKESVLFYLTSPEAKLQRKVDAFDGTAASAVESSFSSMYSSSSPVSDGKWMETQGLYQFEDGSYAIISEAWGKAHHVTVKTTTNTYTDKDGKKHTYTTTTRENDNYIHWSGIIVVAFYDSDFNLKEYKVCGKFQTKYTGTSSEKTGANLFHRGAVSILDALSHKSFVDGNELRLLFYTNDGQEYWTICKMESGKANIVEKAVEYSKADFKIRDVNFAYKDYWVVHLYGENKKRRNDLSILRLHSKDDESEQTDVTDESPELF